MAMIAIGKKGPKDNLPQQLQEREYPNDRKPEHQDLEKATKALEYLQLTSHSMRVLSYVDCLRIWVEEKSLF